MLVFVGVACALRVCPILGPKPVGLPEPLRLVCTITLGARWYTEDWQLEMNALSRIGIGCDEHLAVRAQQVVPWVAPSVAPPVRPACVGHGYRVRLATGCAGTEGSGTSTLGASVRSTLAGFFTLGSDCCTLGGNQSSQLLFLLVWGAVSS